LDRLLLDLNARVITPLISRFGPAVAYRLINMTGTLGKRPDGACFRYDSFDPEPVRRVLARCLRLTGEESESVIRSFFRVETRILLEHLWLGRLRTDYLPDIIDMATVRGIAGEIREKGPLLLLSAHTAYYFVIPWALHTLGARIAYVSADPGRAGAPRHLLSGIDCFQALSKLIPIVFTNEGNTVGRCIDLIGQGYSVIMLVDVPGYQARGAKVKLFEEEVWLPVGCSRIFSKTRVPVAAVLPFLSGISEPYRLSFLSVGTDGEDIVLQQWADALRSVLSHSPESWLGWFYLGEMQ